MLVRWSFRLGGPNRHRNIVKKMAPNFVLRRFERQSWNRIWFCFRVKTCFLHRRSVGRHVHSIRWRIGDRWSRKRLWFFVELARILANLVSNVEGLGVLQKLRAHLWRKMVCLVGLHVLVDNHLF